MVTPKETIEWVIEKLTDLGTTCEHYELKNRSWCMTCTEYCYGVGETGCRGCVVKYILGVLNNGQ